MATHRLPSIPLVTDINLLRWSPLHELVPETPLRHGHAISIDMAYSAAIANNRKLISDAEHRRLLNLFFRAGLSMGHHQT
jgi:3-dehydroquinate synthase